MKLNTRIFQAPLIGLIALVIVSCASVPKEASKLEALRTEYNTLSSDQQTVRWASVELSEADKALRNAEKTVKEKDDSSVIQHHLMIAETRLHIVKEKLKQAKAEEVVKNAEINRTEVLLDARTRDAELAKQDMAIAQQDAAIAQQDAATAQQEAAMLREKTQKLERDVKEITARETERGTILTLNDILFETGKAELMAGSNRALEKVGTYLNEYPNRNIVVEGHTDSTGSSDYNQSLSLRRAESVKTSLINNGVASARVNAKGMGEDYPVASNDNAAGRQQNRRVEIVIEKAMTN